MHVMLKIEVSETVRKILDLLCNNSEEEDDFDKNLSHCK